MSNGKAEAAEKLLTLRPVVSYSVEKHGFRGALYKPENNLYKGEALITLGGSDGIYALTMYLSEFFVRRGITVMSVAYFNQPGLPEKCSGIDLNTIEKAAERLRMLGIRKIGLWGIDTGAIAAMEAAAARPDLFSCVIAVNGLDFYPQGMKKTISGYKKEGMFRRNGDELPWEPVGYSRMRIFSESLKAKQKVTLSGYEHALTDEIGTASRIPVEKIEGPVLLITSEKDTIWPSAACAERIGQRLQHSGFRFECTHISYEHASHLFYPFKIRSANAFKEERVMKAECSKARSDSLNKTMEFISRW